jgi:hypothetical protein
MDRPKPQPLGNVPSASGAPKKAPTPAPAAPAGGASSTPAAPGPQRPPVRLPPVQVPGRFGIPGLGHGSVEAHTQAAARYQALHSDMYEEILGQQNFSYMRAANVCQKLALEPKSELSAEVRAMVFGTVAMRVFHDRSEESYKTLGKRHVVERLIELLRSDPDAIIRIKMARTTTRTAWLLPATNFAKELAGLMTDAEQIPAVGTQLQGVLADVQGDAIARDFFKDAGRLAANMARSVLIGRNDLIQQLTAVFA